MTLMLHSSAFSDHETIPDRYTRSQANLSPPLDWDGAPKGTRSFALIVEDPDAPRGTFRHWAAYDMSPGRTHLDEGAGRRGTDLRQGANDFGDLGYDGPQPPKGDGPHHYHFKLAALDIEHLNVQPRDRAVEIWEEARPHILEEAELVGIYER